MTRWTTVATPSGKAVPQKVARSPAWTTVATPLDRSGQSCSSSFASVRPKLTTYDVRRHACARLRRSAAETFGASPAACSTWSGGARRRAAGKLSPTPAPGSGLGLRLRLRLLRPKREIVVEVEEVNLNTHKRMFDKFTVQPAHNSVLCSIAPRRLVVETQCARPGMMGRSHHPLLKSYKVSAMMVLRPPALSSADSRLLARAC